MYFNIFYIIVIMIFNMGIVYQVNIVNFYVIVIMRYIRREDMLSIALVDDQQIYIDKIESLLTKHLVI